MKPLPVIVGFGGVNAAGRASFHHAFLRLLYGALAAPERLRVLRSLGRLMGLLPEHPVDSVEPRILAQTLVRAIEPQHFDPARVYRHQRIEAVSAGNSLRWRMSSTELPETVPGNWSVTPGADGQVEVTVNGELSFFVPDSSEYPVRSAGQLPTGFDPALKYPSKGHPRGLQMAVYGASDAVRSVGIAWQDLLARVPGDRVAVYASSAMGQLDQDGGGGLLRNSLLGQHPTSRNCSFSLTQMPADFVNAYVLGSIGRTGGVIGACATFLYNLEKAVSDLQNGVVRLAVVGAADAPIIPYVLEGFRAMSALAEDCDLLGLDGQSGGMPDYRNAVRPFGPNCGFAMGESAQYLVLMADDLALECGATIFGAVPGVYIHADGAKRSISSPGIGNYLTLGKACALAADMLGERVLREQTLVYAHGAGTPQNRVTESHVLDRVASAFGISGWVVAAAKCFVGHSLGAASGDQTAFALGTLATGRVPGITTVREFADDVFQARLALSNRHREFGAGHFQGAFVNSKGFGGNNATGLLLSEEAAAQVLERRHGEAALLAYRKRNEAVRKQQQQYEAALLEGHDDAMYHFGANVVEGAELSMDGTEIRIPGFALPVSLKVDNPYGRAE